MSKHFNFVMAVGSMIIQDDMEDRTFAGMTQYC